MCKSAIKWRNSISVAGELTKGGIFGKEIKEKIVTHRTWTNYAKKYMARSGICKEDSKEVMKNKVRAMFLANKRINPINNLNEMSDKLKLGNGVSCMYRALKEGKRKISNTITRMRMGVYIRTSDLARANRLNENVTAGTCISCKKSLKEDAKHLLLECEAFDDIRCEHMKEFIEKMKEKSPNKYEEKVLSLMLEGNLEIPIGRKQLLEAKDKRDTFINAFNARRNSHMMETTKGKE